MQYAKACIKPGYDYFEAKLRQLEGVVSAFKAARIFNPAKVNFLKPDYSSIDSLRCFKFLDKDQLLGGLRSELPTYLAMAEDTADEIDTLCGGNNMQKKFHHGPMPARKSFSVNPLQHVLRGSFLC